MSMKSRGLVGMLALAVQTSECWAGPIQDDPSKRNHNWLAICPSAWLGEATGLKSLRSWQGYDAGIWTYEDIDASYGSHTPTALRAALVEAYNSWTIHPLRWVFDWRSREEQRAQQPDRDWSIENEELGFNDPHLVGLLPYMDLNGDNMPDIFVGRLPATSATDVWNYVIKAILHDIDPDPSYGRSLMLIGDEAVGGDPVWARQLADDLFANWVTWGGKHTVRVSDLPACAPPHCYPQYESAAISAWNAGPGLIMTMGTYNGWWTLTSFFDLCSNWSISKLAPTGKYGVLLNLSCGSTGTDTGHDTSTWTCGKRPVAEQLLMGASDRGVVAVIGPTRTTKQRPNAVMGKHLMINQQRGDRTWGEIVAHAMRDMVIEEPSLADHVYEYVLEGDPALRVISNGGPTEVSAEIQGLFIEKSFQNPLRGKSTLVLGVTRTAAVRVAVYDVAGHLVKTLLEGEETKPGRYLLAWDRGNDRGSKVAAGLYLVRIQVDQQSVVQKIVVTH
jgi:hypothetical protein